MRDALDFIPQRVNTGRLLTAYTLNELKQLIDDQLMVLPICSFGTPVEELAALGPLVLPPLYHEALDDSLKQAILERIQDCFPFVLGTAQRNSFRGKLEIVELPQRELLVATHPLVLAFSVDTAVEQHGPHLPLATDTIQSYGVLKRLHQEFSDVVLGPPLDYGQLTWGLPFGLSIDITAPLLTRYVTKYVDAHMSRLSPSAVYVVDVHGSLIHRNAIVEGITASRCHRWKFRWLYEPLVEFTSDRGDQHAGGVETALVQVINPGLVDSRWWPDRIDELAENQMTMAMAMELSRDLPHFISHVDSHPLNGIVGDVRNYFALDAVQMFQKMVEVARRDIVALM